MNANFRGKGASPTNDFCHQKSRSLGYRMVKKSAEKFNRLSRVHQRHRRQTTDNRQTESRSQVANVNASSRPLKTDSKYSLALDDLIRFWRSKVKVTAGRGDGEGIHLDPEASEVYPLVVLLAKILNSTASWQPERKNC